MAPPSNVPSAQRVAEVCFEEYRLTVDPDVDSDLRGDLEAFAQHFADMNMLETVFIDSIVPWAKFLVPPNPGHAAIADLLIVRAAEAGLSSNFDNLIEKAAMGYGCDFQGSLDGDHATIHSKAHSPLLKFHGCYQIDRRSTVWVLSQIKQNEKIANRIDTIKAWITANLRNKDLLVVGFWSDWHYLNQVLGSVLTDVGPLAITLVDPTDAMDLKAKAPDLWAIAQKGNIDFRHVQESGADVLDQLRRAFSKNYLRQVLEAGRQQLESETGTNCDADWFDTGDLNSEALYSWRQDAEGVPDGVPARNSRPKNVETLGLLHLLIRRAGAQQTELGYEKEGRTIRVINGAGMILASVREKFVNAPSTPTTDLVVVSGATDTGQPGNIMTKGRENDIVRPAPGGRWLDFDGARKALNL